MFLAPARAALRPWKRDRLASRPGAGGQLRVVHSRRRGVTSRQLRFAHCEGASGGHGSQEPTSFDQMALPPFVAEPDVAAV
jgi:hypothetical protein